MVSRLDEAIKVAGEELPVPSRIIGRNPGISPYSMLDLLEYFRAFQRPHAELLPVPPESEDAVDVYVHVLGRINTHLGDVTVGRDFALAILVVQWMRGYPLSRLIQKRVDYFVRKDRPYRLPSVIRSTMQDVEEVARFRVPKYTACYIDLLKLFLTEIGEESLANEIPDLNVWLEFGASQTTQLSLMGVGLSRTSAIALSGFIADDSLDETAVLEWLRAADLDGIDLPRPIVSEIKRLLSPEHAL